MKGRDDERLRCIERAWEGTRLEAQALAEAYEQLEPRAPDGPRLPRRRRCKSAAMLFAQGGERCPTPCPP